MEQHIEQNSTLAHSSSGTIPVVQPHTKHFSSTPATEAQSNETHPSRTIPPLRVKMQSAIMCVRLLIQCASCTYIRIQNSNMEIEVESEYVYITYTPLPWQPGKNLSVVV